jgi:type I restriction enzyme M protein
LRIGALRAALAPLKEKRLKLQAEINRLTFAAALENPLTTENTESTEKNKKKNSPENSSGLRVDSVHSVLNALADAQARLADLQSKIVNPQSEMDRLTRQFWVTKEQVKANKYDLSASRYRQVDADAVYHEKPSVTLERLARLESVMMSEIEELKKLVKG